MRGTKYFGRTWLRDVCARQPAEATENTLRQPYVYAIREPVSAKSMGRDKPHQRDGDRLGARI